MAKRISHRKADQSRVYKAGDVHKRRVDRKSRPEVLRAAEPKKPNPEVAEEEIQRGTERTQFMDIPGVLPDNPEQPASQTAPLTAASPEEHAPQEGEKAPVPTKTGKIAVLRSKLPETIAGTGKAPKIDVPQVMNGEGSGQGAAAEAQQTTGRLQSDEDRKARAAQRVNEMIEPASAEKPEGESGETASADAAEQAGPKPIEGKPTIRRIGEKAKSAKLPKRTMVIAGAAAAVVVIAAIVAFVVFGRGGDSSDPSDIQGAWYVAGKTTPVNIDGEYVHFNDADAFAYTIDPKERALSVTLGIDAGKEHYWFSGDKQFLVLIEDGAVDDPDAVAKTLLSMLQGRGNLSSEEYAKLLDATGVVAMGREPSYLASVCGSMHDRAAAAKAAAEEREKLEAEERERQEMEQALAEGGEYY